MCHCIKVKRFLTCGFKPSATALIVSETSLLLARGFTMVACHLHTQRQGKKPGGPSMWKAKWKPFLLGDSAGFCSSRLSALCGCTCVCFLSVCVHQLPRSVLFKAVSVLLYFQTPACSLPSLLTPVVSPALKCMMPFPSILSSTSTHTVSSVSSCV